MPDPLTEIAERLAKAAPKPWNMAHMIPCSVIWVDDVNFAVLKGDREAIELAYRAPTDLAYLLARVKAAEAVCAAAEKHAKFIKPLHPAEHYQRFAGCEGKSAWRLLNALTTWQATRG